MPRLQIDLALPLHEKADLCIEALRQWNDERVPDCMVRGTHLVRMTERGELEELDVDSLRTLLSRCAACGKVDARTGDWRPSDPPQDLCRAVLAMDGSEYRGLPRVDRVVDVPVATEDGLVEETGHHPGPRLYLRPAVGLSGVRGHAEHVDDVQHARDLLLGDLLGDFGFADAASQAHALGMLLLPFLRERIPGPTPLHVVLAPDIGSGKAQPVSEPVQTPAGERPIGDLRPGDEVYGPEGAPRRVVSVHPQGEREILEVRLSDGVAVRCDADHLWTIRGWKNGKYVGRTVKAAELMAIGEELHSGPFLPMAAAVRRPDADLPVNPRLLGLLLGDGTLAPGNGVKFSSGDPELLDEIEELAAPVDARRQADGITVALTTPRGRVNPLLESLRELGLVGCRAAEKFVPAAYRLGSISQRLALLRGLMDTDGCASGEFSTVSPRLAADVRWLVESLGGTARTTTKQGSFRGKAGQVAYRVYVAMPGGMSPFGLARKARAYNDRTKYQPRRRIVSVKPAGREEAVCIRVDAPDGLYLTTGHAVTHNTTLAQACLMPGCGLVPATPGAGTEEEWRKRITASLLSGAPALLLDNLSGDLDSGALAAALTSGEWRDRILGESRQVTLPVRNVWAATGNNLGLSREQVRRAVPIFLEPGERRPADRPRSAFRHPDLLGWGMRNRRALVSAALTLVDHWLRGPYHVEAGTAYVRDNARGPLRGRATLGSFEGWAGVVGGCLEAAGVRGFLGNRDRLRLEADEASREAEEFLDAWHRLGTGPLELRELAPMCEGVGELADLVPQDMPRGRTTKERLSYWLRQNRGARFGQRRIVAIEGRRRRWAVE